MRHIAATAFSLLSFVGHAQAPTWADDVACIIYSHCTTCHRPGGIGSEEMNLTTYTEAHAHRSDISDAVSIRYMPPWPPDEAYRTLAHERVLSQGEIDIIAAWAAAGGPEGDAGNAPPQPVFSSNWSIPDPDISARMPEYTLPTLDDDLYRAFVLHVNNPTDSYIKSFEVIPGNTAAVHHVLVFQDTTGQAQLLDDADPDPGYTSFGGIGVSNAKLVGLWVPGSGSYTAPPGMGIKLFAGADIVIQVHYPESADGLLDSTRVNFLFDNSPFVRTIDINAVLDHLFTLTDGPLVIPPNTVRTFHNQYTVPIPATITSIGPHAHLLCTNMKAYAVAPGNDTIPLIDIPDWDFHWQGLYDFRKPIFLPVGSVLHGEATYDNTTANEENPNHLNPQWVTLGESTTDEMMLFYFAYTFGFPSDTNVVVDNSLHPEHYLDCTTEFTGVSEPTITEVVRIAPSPAHERFTVSTERDGCELLLINAQGQETRRMRLVRGDNPIDVAACTPGTYIAVVRARDGTVIHKSPLVLK